MCFVDLLSPPPHLPETYAMGLFHWNLTKNPLIEVRGYVNILHNGTDKIKMGNVEDFIKKEYDWFFEHDE